MAALSLKLGQTIETRDGRQGTVRYIGALHIAEGEWLGLELSDASGKNDGSVKGERYFSCLPNHGIFVRKESVVKVIRQAAPVTAARPETHAPTSGIGTRPRPASGISADVARKRQSLMSPASGGTVAAASRLSLRSPTKSPVKPPSVAPSTTNTSAASTPRTSTPATTARTSDSSAKSRTSTLSRPSVAPSTNGSRTTTHTSRPSLSTAGTKPTRPSSISSKPSLASKRPSSTTNPSLKQGLTRAIDSRASKKDEATVGGEGISEDQGTYIAAAEADGVSQEGEKGETDSVTEDTKARVPSTPVAKPSIGNSRTRSTSQAVAANVESRAAQVRELEQLKAKIRTLEKQRVEDQEKLEQNERLQGENDRYKNIIQALQTKLKGSQQEMGELRSKYEEIQAQVANQPERSGEQESELELATLDKEMAEERAETYYMELEALRAKHEELELEVEILREENQELGSTMSPEEKAGAGWLQMERERERLRDALVMLRDMTQQTESDMKAEIKELRDGLDETERTASKYTETAQKLTVAEETNRHLVEQLEAIESNDEVVEAMEAQREQHLQSIEQLRKQIQELEEHIQVTDELENFHLEEEKRMHAQLDETEALLNESNRQNVDQDHIIEDLEYTLTKFRGVVQGLQSDIDELRRSRDISEIQANEMSSKSRAMMDLNLRLQSNAAKSQSKAIDSELDKVRAELGAKHVEMMSLFTMESFESERNSLLTLLCFRRLLAKAELISKLLSERIRERAHLSPGEEIFHIFEVVERFQWIAGICQRFDKFLSSCTMDEFASCGRALHEVEPVERVATGWLEAMRRDELGTDGPEHLLRMQGVLTDLAEKLIVENNETRATEILVETRMIENFADSISGQTTALVRLVQSKLGGPVDEDEESLVFDKKMDQLTTRARTVKYLSSKVVQQLTELRMNSMCLGETYWVLFEDAERQAESLSRLLRKAGASVAEDLSKIDPEQTMTYSSILDSMTTVLHNVEIQGDGFNSNGADDDAFGLLNVRLSGLQSIVDDLSMKSGDLSTAVEFEASTAPWVLRSRHLKSLKVIPAETQEEVTRLERRSQELGSRLMEREKTIEEMSMRVELAEKRMKDSRARDDKDKAHQEEVDKLRAEHEKAESQIVELRSEIQSLTQNSMQAVLELEALRKFANGDAVPIPGSPGLVDDRAIKQVQLEVNLLQAEIAALQAGIRFLREENYNLRVPTAEIMIEAARSTWLEPPITAKNGRNVKSQASFRQKQLEREAHEVYSNLIDVASSLRPVRLHSPRLQADIAPQDTNSETQKHPTSWQPESQTTRYAVLRQREEFERWNAQRSEFINRAKITQNSFRSKTSLQQAHALRLPRKGGSNLVAYTENRVSNKKANGPIHETGEHTASTNPDGVRIVEA